MSCTKAVKANTLLTRHSASSVLKTLNASHIATRTARPGLIYTQHITSPRRNFTTTRPLGIKEFFPEPDAPHIRTTEAAWTHPVYTEEQMKAVVVAHREAKTVSDKVALAMVRVLRFGLDLATGYSHDKAVALGNKDSQAALQKYGMSERKWMIRYVAHPQNPPAHASKPAHSNSSLAETSSSNPSPASPAW